MKTRRFQRRGFRRKSRVVWFTPRGLAHNPESDSDDLVPASGTCYTPKSFQVNPNGASTGPTILDSPIVWNLEQSLYLLNPDTGDPNIDPGMVAHPLSERWTIQRIVGQVVVAINPIVVEVPNDIVGGLFHWGIVRMSTLGSSVLTPSPRMPDTANESWLQLGRGVVAPGNIISTGISSATALQIPTTVVVPIDVRVKRTVRPEETVSFVFEGELGGDADVNNFSFFVTPFLRALLSRTV